VQLERLDITQRDVASAVVELQRRAYRVEAELIGSDRIPSLHETVEELQGSDESFLGAYVDGTLAGAISWRLDAEVLDVHRLVVDPTHFRVGIGTALVRAAVAAEADAIRVIVQTGALNEPAKRLYRREGFVEIDEIEVVPGLWVTRFGKRF
jgi:ribosomal protein S18 acetylase RimI-like enzyme